MTYQTKGHILIVDDDESICKTLSVILRAKGYQTTTAATAKEAIEKTRTKFYNLALLDIKLPDMEGTKLLAQLQEITPETIKIMITGYPSMQNAMEALNLGAEAYILKPPDPAELLKTIKNKIEKRMQTEEITGKRIAKWVQSKARKQSTTFEDFLEETASELADFGLTKSQAKVYITLTGLGVASASEIAALSKIRREEVYRVMPKLERHGIIMRKLETPRRFSAIPPEKCVQLLLGTKLKTIKQEIDKLRQKQIELVPKLKAIKLPIQRHGSFIDVIPKRGKKGYELLFTKTIDTIQNAKRRIDIIAPLEYLRYGYINCPKNLKEKLAKRIKTRIITESHEPDAFTKEVIQHSETSNNLIELRQVERLPFNLMVVDDSEAIWGEFQPKNENAQNLWTSNPTQIAILRMSFESLWQKSSSITKLSDGQKHKTKVQLVETF